MYQLLKVVSAVGGLALLPSTATAGQCDLDPVCVDGLVCSNDGLVLEWSQQDPDKISINGQVHGAQKIDPLELVDFEDEDIDLSQPPYSQNPFLKPVINVWREGVFGSISQADAAGVIVVQFMQMPTSDSDTTLATGERSVFSGYCVGLF